MSQILDETRYVGEIGLDYVTPDKQERRRQQEVFAKILENCAACGDKVLTVHSRRSATDVIAAIGDHFPGRVILHWFSGSAKDLRTAISYGIYFSVNPAMIRSKNGQARIAEMPKDRVLTETDGPFVKVGKEPARPPQVADALVYLAAVWQVFPDEARSIVANNLERAVGEF
jgi:TatD DNase family protein